MVAANAWGIAAAIVVWAAGLTGILVTTAPEETRAFWRWSTRRGRHLDPRRSFADLSGADGDGVDSGQVCVEPPWASRRELFVLL
jgi:hypothetical protein